MMFTGSVEDARAYIEKGFDAVANSIDTIIFAEAYKAMVDAIKAI